MGVGPPLERWDKVAECEDEHDDDVGADDVAQAIAIAGEHRAPRREEPATILVLSEAKLPLEHLGAVGEDSGVGVYTTSTNPDTKEAIVGWTGVSIALGVLGPALVDRLERARKPRDAAEGGETE